VTYNGWTNYPTWNVKLWLDNDEGLYRQALAIVREARSKHGGAAVVPLANTLREWVRDDVATCDEASMRSDLFGYALDEVNWREIATVYLAEEAS
jgi:hypothetical protein